MLSNDPNKTLAEVQAEQGITPKQPNRIEQLIDSTTIKQLQDKQVPTAETSKVEQKPITDISTFKQAGATTDNLSTFIQNRYGVTPDIQN